MTVNFRGPFGKFGDLDPTSIHAVVVDQKRYKTVAHFIHSQKFASTDRLWSNKIAKASTPKEAARLARDKSRVVRPDWERVQADTMRRALVAKAEQHPRISDLLLSTDERAIVRRSSDDSYWGEGLEGGGENMLGRLWVEVREEIREKKEQGIFSYRK